MAGWSPFSDGPSLDSLQILHKLQSKGTEDLKLRGLLDQILSAFFNEILPFPPSVLGDGRSVDFFRLYWAVREKGGYDSVTANGCWGPVMEEAGLGSGASSSARWIYVKYLDAFDRWLQRISGEIAVGGGSEAGLETAIKGLLCGGQEYPKVGADRNGVRATLRGNGHVVEGGIRGPSSFGVHQFSELGSGRDESPSRLSGNEHVGESAVTEPPLLGAQTFPKLDFDMNEVPPMVREIEHVDDTAIMGSSCGAQEFSEWYSDGSEVRMRERETGSMDQSSFMRSLCGVHQFSRPVSERNEVWTMTRGSALVGESVIASTADKGCIADYDGDEVVVLDSTVANVEFNSLKRKRERESLLGMVDWVKRLAKNPCDPGFGMATEQPRWRVHRIAGHWARVLLARAVLLQRRHVSLSAEGSLLQKKQRVGPSMYEDSSCVDHLNSRSRKSHSISYLETLTAPDCDISKSLIPHASASDNDPNKRVLRTIGSLTAQKVVDLFCKDHIQKRVPVGPYFQAEVPDWTGAVSNDPDDPKWLGTQHWPPKLGEPRLTVRSDPIGKGRPDACSCQFPRSIDCVRFHVAEKRSQLKDELGPAFYEWRFDRMGEEVSLSWTGEEEGIFGAIASRNNPALTKSLWDPTYRSFYTKSRQSLISYYFNVYLLRRRSYQNRVTPNHTDSDDEDSGFGFLRNGFGRYAIKAGGTNSILWGQNKQCAGPNGSTHVD